MGKNETLPEQRRKTICFCNSNIPWGGGESWHFHAARSFAARGWRVLLLCHPDGELYHRAGRLTDVRRVPLGLHRLSFVNPLVGLRLYRFFRREAVHALIMNLPADLKAAAPAARAAGVRHVVYRRGSALPIRNTALNRCLFGRVLTRVIANSEATREQVLANNPRLIPLDRLTVLYNGFDIEALDAALEQARAEQAQTEQARTQGRGSDGPREATARPFTLGNAGRLNRQKGQHLLLHLGRRLLDAGLNVRILIAGQGEREAELRALSAALGLQDRVRFLGFLPDLSPFWLEIDLFVLTSLWEGFGNVLVEAMLARKPVFAFAVSNLPELVRQGPEGNGRLFSLPAAEQAHSPGASGEAGTKEAAARRLSQRDDGTEKTAVKRLPEEKGGLEAMAEAVLELAAHPEEARRMGAAGRRFALRFSQQACMDALEDLLP